MRARIYIYIYIYTGIYYFNFQRNVPPGFIMLTEATSVEKKQVTSGISVAYCHEIRSSSEEGKRSRHFFLKSIKCSLFIISPVFAVLQVYHNSYFTAFPDSMCVVLMF